MELAGVSVRPGDGSIGLLPKANLRHGTQRHIAETVGPMRTANLTTVLRKRMEHSTNDERHG
jgi:hypothetical protein